MKPFVSDYIFFAGDTLYTHCITGVSACNNYPKYKPKSATVRKGVTAYSCAGVMGKVGPHSQPQKTMGDIQYGY